MFEFCAFLDTNIIRETCTLEAETSFPSLYTGHFRAYISFGAKSTDLRTLLTVRLVEERGHSKNVLITLMKVLHQIYKSREGLTAAGRAEKNLTERDVAREKKVWCGGLGRRSLSPPPSFIIFLPTSSSIHPRQWSWFTG